MRILVLSAFFFPRLVTGQLIDTVTSYKLYSTLDTINATKLEITDLSISQDDFVLTFSRKITLDVIENYLNDSSLLEEFIPTLRTMSKYIEDHKIIEWDNPWNYGSGIPSTSDDPEQLTKELFKVIACDMLSNGQFELEINSITQNKVLLIDAEIYDGYFGPVFTTMDNMGFWIWEEQIGIACGIPPDVR